MKKVLSLLIILLALSVIHASCNEGQININSASATELDKLTGIGPVKAEAIINARPFSSVDSLIDVSGIGNVTLTNIKEQGLACVENSEQTQQETNEEKVIETNTTKIEETNNSVEEKAVLIKTTEIKNSSQPKIISSENKTIISAEVIKLIPKDIKSEDDNEIPDKSKYAFYGFISFCFLLGFLFLVKLKKQDKNEFK